MTKPLLAVAAITALLSTPAYAAYNPEHKADTNFNRMDKNKDNVVSKEEFLKPFTDRFQLIDRDGNGSISMEEMRVFWHQKKDEYEKFKHRLDHKN
ncbi:MAG: EF-hand domain-containing protein [Mariprofundaceae bacterium]